jgi:catechol 2,3-dioxygenase-like lactoylglutathione lyase family enzyme
MKANIGGLEVTMLRSNKIIGFVATKDYAKARHFYENILGLDFVNQDQFAIEFKSGGNMIRISKGDFTPAPYTVLGWEVQTIDKVVKELTERGVTFEKYSFLKQNELGIWDAPGGDRVAWFKDPDGNLLSVSQHVS